MSKVRKPRYPDIEMVIARNHPCELPEPIKLPVTGDLKGYFRWIGDVSR